MVVVAVVVVVIVARKRVTKSTMPGHGLLIAYNSLDDPNPFRSALPPLAYSP